MIRLSRILIATGAVLTFAACSDTGPTAPSVTSASAAGDLVVLSAPLPSGSCTYTPNGTGYDVTVTWSGLSVTNIDLYPPGGGQPLAQEVLGHPTRKGSETYTLLSAPGSAQVTGIQGGFILNCVSGT
jgi:hypothetical protein